MKKKNSKRIIPFLLISTNKICRGFAQGKGTTGIGPAKVKAHRIGQAQTNKTTPPIIELQLEGGGYSFKLARHFFWGKNIQIYCFSFGRGHFKIHLGFSGDMLKRLKRKRYR